MADGLKGDVEVRRALLKLAASMPQAAGNALADEAELIKTDAQENYVPVDLSTLKNSARVHEPEVKGTDISVEISFGGGASAYALAIHEHPSRYSPPSWKGVPVNFSPAGTGPKYLERPMKEAINGMAERIGARLKAEGQV